MKKCILLLTMSFLLPISGCESTEPALPDNENPDLLFSRAEPLAVEQVITDNRIVFRILSPAPSFLRIGIFTRPPTVANGMLQNPEDEIWSYLARGTENTTVTLPDGEFSPNAPLLDETFFRCSSETLYWAAWGWDPTARLINYATARNLEVNTPGIRPELRLIRERPAGIRNPDDTLTFAGNTALVELTFQNSGTEDIGEGFVTITQETTLNFNKILTTNDLPVGATVTDTIEFVIPATMEFGSEIPFQVSYLTNGCFTASQEFIYRVNVSRYRVEGVALMELSAEPPSAGWDPGLPATTNLPDPLYRLIKVSSSETIHKSNTITDADPATAGDDPIAEWENLPEDISLALNTPYRIEVTDENLPANDEFNDYLIGSAGFFVRSFFPERPAFYFLTHEDFVLRLHITYSD